MGRATIDTVTSETIATDRVLLEITESALLEPDPTVTANLETLHQAGFRIAIDDFGTGYSSLAYLKRLNVDWLKIDRMFVQDLGDDETSEALVRAIIVMAHELGIGVVAEGVETPRQLALLRELGCDGAQGFLIGRPAADALESLARPAAIART